MQLAKTTPLWRWLLIFFFRDIWHLVSLLNWTKHLPTWSPDTLLHVNVNCSGWSRFQRRWHRPKVANLTNHFPAQNWQFIIAILNQWLGCFWVEPKTEIWHHKRQSVLLRPLINKFDFHGRRREEIGSKSIKNHLFPPSFSSLPPFLLSFSLHRGLWPPLLSPPPSPPTQLLAGDRVAAANSLSLTCRAISSAFSLC